MFISEEEAQRRLRDSNNLLNRLGIIKDKQPKEELPDVYDEVAENPTNSSDDDPVRIAVLAGRRAMKPANARGGRYPGQKNIPPVFRGLIGAAAKIGTTNSAAKAFGVSHLAAHNYSQAKTHNVGPVDVTLFNKIEQDTLAIRNQVLGVLAYTVAGITPESIENKDPKELSIIARNLSSIMASTKPPADFGDKTTNAQVIVFSPEQGAEPDYDRVEIG